MTPKDSIVFPKYKRRVGLAFAQGIPFVEKVRHGIADYASAHGGWSFSVMPEMLSPSVDWLKHARIDGALVFVVTMRDLKLVRALRRPIVNLAAHLDPSAVPSVMVDHRRIGEMAAEFLLERGFSRLAYYGTGSLWYSQQRHAGFSATALRAGAQCQAHMAGLPQIAAAQWRDEHRALLRWLCGLKPPTGILASMDLRASMLVDACAEAGLRVPDDIAIIGVDNDPVVCELGSVPITSVARNDRLVGWEAAAMLDRLMNGNPPSRMPRFVEPEQIVERKSTDTFAVDDAVVAGLLAELRENLDKPFGVEWLVERSGHSRRWLELHFRQSLGRSPHEVLNWLRVSKARELLAGDTCLMLTDVAARCGFADLRRFRITFRKKMGILPRKYRDDLRRQRTKKMPGGIGMRGAG
ncbi:MAG: XylR family transcriptional regulator [Opitutaceae bacterium]|jgi:LacI family transcriptional regulator|nr:XylR family transcriptional regulator [Opitutaceae bacterium]